MQLLQEIAPYLQRVGIMYNPDTAPYAPPLIASAKASAIRNATVIELHVRNDSDIHTAAASFANQPNGGLLVIPEPFTGTRSRKIIAQSDEFRLPTLNLVLAS